MNWLSSGSEFQSIQAFLPRPTIVYTALLDCPGRRFGKGTAPAVRAKFSDTRIRCAHAREEGGFDA